jgi:hypothetical protein
MKQVNVHSRLYYYYAAALTTGIVGILHLRLYFNGLDRGINDIGIFFLLSGIHFTSIYLIVLLCLCHNPYCFL